MESVKVYVYRYIWQTVAADESGEEKKITNCKILSGLMAEHETFSDMLKNDDSIIKATRIYLHEYDVSQIEQYEFIK